MQKVKQIIALLLVILTLLGIVAPIVFGETVPGEIIIQDGEDLLSAEEEKLLYLKMQPISEYGGVAFASVSQYGDTASYAESLYRQYFGRDSGTLFLIDMGERNIWIFSDGAIYRTVTKAYANTITDNVYRYASRGEYYACAAEVYDEIYTLLKGGRISQPMKLICNIFIACIVAFLGNFILLLIQRSKKKEPVAAATAAMTTAVGVSVIAKNMVSSHRSRHVESSGGGGGGGEGGGGGGGGSSGGGGGHSF